MKTDANTPVSIAIVGCGKITRSAHLPAALRSKLVSVTALVDSRLEHAQALARQFSLDCLVAQSLDEVIDKVEGVLIATPNSTHHPIAARALSAGIPVLMEKPLTTEYQHALELCELAERHRTFISVGYKTRHYASVKTLKQLLDERFFGQINHFRYVFGSKGGWAPLSGYTIDRKMSGGGVLVNTGSHFLDRMLYWFGWPSSIAYEDDSHGGVDANCRARFGFEGPLGAFSGTLFLSKTVSLPSTFTLDTERYVVHLPETEADALTLVPRDRPHLTLRLTSSAETGGHADDSFQAQLEEFAIRARRPEAPLTVDGREGARSVKLIEDMYHCRTPLAETWRAARPTRSRQPRPSRIAIFGASGFVGSTMVERLIETREFEFVPLIHSLGNATRLARYPLSLKSVDVLDDRAVDEAIKGCDIVVNCSRGSAQAMLRGLQNIITAAKRNRVQKLIHLGSAAIYGFDPAPESRDPSAPPRPASKYGELKLKQDELVFELHKAGVAAMVLCPPNISGPYSPFILSAVEMLRSGTLHLVDEGRNPINLVHVDNLVEAILAAAASDRGWGERYFVNSTTPQRWKDFFESLGQVVGGWSSSVPSIPRSAVLAPTQSEERRATLKDNVRALVSGEFREALSTVPVLKGCNDLVASLFSSLGPATQERLRQRLRKPTIIRPPKTTRVSLDHLCIRAQVSQVHHSPATLVEKLGYQPALNAAQELETTAQWLEFIGKAKRVETVGVA